MAYVCGAAPAQAAASGWRAWLVAHCRRSEIFRTDTTAAPPVSVLHWKNGLITAMLVNVNGAVRRVPEKVPGKLKTPDGLDAADVIVPSSMLIQHSMRFVAPVTDTSASMYTVSPTIKEAGENSCWNNLAVDDAPNVMICAG